MTPRLDDALCHPPAAGDDDEGRAECVEVIAQDIDLVGRVNDLRRHLRKALNDGVNRRRRIVGSKCSRNAGERGSDARERMLARCIEHICSDWYDNHVS